MNIQDQIGDIRNQLDRMEGQLEQAKSQADIAREEAISDMCEVISTAVNGATVTINEQHFNWLYDAGYRKQGEVVSSAYITGLVNMILNGNLSAYQLDELKDELTDNYIITKRTDKG